MRRTRRSSNRMVALLLLAMCAGAGQAGTGTARAQGAAAETQSTSPDQTGRRSGAYAGMGRVMGEVTAISGANLTVKAGDGATTQVVTTENTRLMKDRGPVHLGDLHVGDGLMAIGILDAPNHTLHAAVVMAQDAAQVKAMRENLGKTYITGRVTALDLDNARMTVERADHVPQTIGFDETTSFRRTVRGGGGGTGTRPGGGSGGDEGSGGRGPGGEGFGGGRGMGAMMGGDGLDRAFNNGESITLADIKVGDFVFGSGGLKNGVFVPTRVIDSPPGQRHGPRNRNGAGAGAPSSGTGADAAENPPSR